MRRALAATAVTSAALALVALAELRRLLRRAAGRKDRMPDLKAAAWMTEAVYGVGARLSEGERPLVLVVTAQDRDGTRRRYTAKPESGHVVVTVKKVER